MYIPTQQPGNGGGWNQNYKNNSNNWNSGRNWQNPTQNPRNGGYGSRYNQHGPPQWPGPQSHPSGPQWSPFGPQNPNFGQKMGGNWSRPTQEQANLWRSSCGGQKFQTPPTPNFQAPPTRNFKGSWLKPAPNPVENAWKSANPDQHLEATPTFEAPPTEDFPDLSEAKFGAKKVWKTRNSGQNHQAPPTTGPPGTSETPPIQKMKPGQKSFTNAYKSWNFGKKPQAPPTNGPPGPSGSKIETPPTKEVPNARKPQNQDQKPQAPPTNGPPGPSGSKIETPPTKPAPEPMILCDNLKGHKYASTMEKMLRELAAKIAAEEAAEKAVEPVKEPVETEKKVVEEEPVKKPVQPVVEQVETEKKKPMNEDRRRGCHPRNQCTVIENPIRDPFIIKPGYSEVNLPQRMPRPHVPWRTGEDVYKPQSYATIDLKRSYLVYKHMEEEYRKVKVTGNMRYVFESDLEPASVPKSESPDVAKHSKRSSISSGVGTSLDDLEEYSFDNKDEEIKWYASRTPTRARSPEVKFDRTWDDRRIYLDPRVCPENRYLQCTISTCFCHGRHPSLQPQ